MKKLVLVAAMLAMVLVAAAPALAEQDASLDYDGDGVVTTQDLVAIADLDGDGAITEADLAIAQGQAGAGQSGDGVVKEDDSGQEGSAGTVYGNANTAADQYAAADQYGDAEEDDGLLPPTGGASLLLVLGAGTLLVAGGLVARRIFQ